MTYTAFPIAPMHLQNGGYVYGSPGISLRMYLALHAPTEEIDALMPSSVADCAELLGIPEIAYDYKVHYRALLAKVRYQWADEILKGETP